MSLLVFVHIANEGPCVLGRVLQEHGHKLRQVRLYAGEPVPPDLDDIDGIISMGGPMNVDEADQHPWMKDELACLKRAHDTKVPIIGICLGAQLIAAALGGEVTAMAAPEVGWAPVRQAFPGTIDTLHSGIAWNTTQVHMHGQEVTKLPPDGVPLSGSKQCRIQSYKVGLTTYAYQYHFEWSRKDIEAMAHIPFVTQAGGNAEEILKQASLYYEGYRRVGDRLCENIAEYLFVK
ncbi:MAG: type 1 glutamine amidotransferase [Phycisphaeraceae bacterium]